MTFRVFVECDSLCENYEGPRVVLVTTDAVKAIRECESHRDMLHYAYVVIDD